MHSSGFFRIKLIASLILKRKIYRSHTISDQSLLLSTIVLNDYFLSIPFKTVETVPLSFKSPLSYLPNFGELEFRLSTVSMSDVISILSGLDSGKATVCDELSLRFLKACPAEMGGLVATIINQSISTCTFPNSLKCAVVTPVQKSKDNYELTNFRPISVLLVFSKILELVVYDQFISHLFQVFAHNTLLRMSCYLLQIVGVKQLIKVDLLWQDFWT